MNWTEFLLGVIVGMLMGVTASYIVVAKALSGIRDMIESAEVIER